MSDGIGCQCYARCSSECGCENVDWTPREVIELRNQLSHLQKLCEEQKGELARIQALPEQEWLEVGALVLGILADAAGKGFAVRETDAVKAMDRGHMYVARLKAQRDEARSQLAHLNLILEGYKLLAGLSTTDHLKVQGMIESQLAEKDKEITNCERTSRDLLSIAAKYQENLRSQLATQTERVKELELDYAQVRADLSGAYEDIKVQTERVRKLTEALTALMNTCDVVYGQDASDKEHEAFRKAWELSEQALNQDSLGDWKNKEVK